MGKGDQRSRRGKIAIGSFGRLRPRKKATTYATAESSKKVVSKKATK